MENKSRDYFTIDLLQIVKALWKRAWIIVVSGIVTAAIGFSVASFAIAPKYSASVMLYVNNSSFSLGNTNFSISASEISAAQSLVKTYCEILNNRTTLERIIDKSDLSYTYKELSGMITASRANDTEIMRVSVISEDPYEAADIANCIAEVLPVRISEIIDGASMEVVDSAIPILDKVEPSITKYTATGLILGALISCLIISLFAIMDDKIHDEEYIRQTYDYPILGKIPDLLENGKKHYGYYYRKNSNQGKGR